MGTEAAALSAREREVARLVTEGLTNRAIAARLFVSERTVESHLERIRRKLGFHHRSEVAAWIAGEADGRTDDTARDLSPREAVDREHLADERQRRADQRELRADAREARADQREAALDEREHLVQQREMRTAGNT
jgi:DNA-binding CsgD family transcriptional regulator